LGVAVGEDTVREVDELVAECDDPGANRSEIVEIVLTVFIQSVVVRLELPDRCGNRN
jgi:hypothetical protein